MPACANYSKILNPLSARRGRQREGPEELLLDVQHLQHTSEIRRILRQADHGGGAALQLVLPVGSHLPHSSGEKIPKIENVAFVKLSSRRHFSSTSLVYYG